jgi:hypothetical protein
MKNLILIGLFVFASIELSAQHKTDTCSCKKVIKSFKYFEKSFYKKGEYFHYPQEAVVMYDGGVCTSPPLNKHIQVMLDCTPVELTDHGDLLIYRVAEKEIDQWAIWLQQHCSEGYSKYRKRHNYKKEEYE